MRWAQITVEAKEESADAVTNVLAEAGCAGTAECRSCDRVSGACASVAGYLPVDDRLERSLESIRTRVRQMPGFGLELASEEIAVTWVEDEEWATAWKKFFKPLRFGRVVIKPTWEEFEARPGDVIVEIDPGMAFGTGNHPTTALCLLILQDYVKGGESVLDVGTGSGILAIAAAKLGAARVKGLDIDPVAIAAAEKNVSQAGMGDMIELAVEDSPRAFNGTADIVVANIIPNVIIAMAGDLRDKVKPGGTLITSGIIGERAEEVKSKLRSLGLDTLETRESADWVAIVSRRQE